MISRPFCSWERTFFASSIIAYWPLAVIMPPTKVCPQCKAAVPVKVIALYGGWG